MSFYDKDHAHNDKERRTQFFKKIENLTKAQVRKSSKSWTSEEREFYISQEHTEQKEVLLEDPTQSEYLSNEDHVEGLFLGPLSEDDPDERKEAKRLVRKLIYKVLTKRERQFIWSRYWDSLSQREIAEKFNVSRWNVRITLDRARKKISVHLKQKINSRSNIFKLMAAS